MLLSAADLAQRLGRLPLLRRVPPVLWAAVAPQVEARACPAGTLLAEAGAPATHLVAVVSGHVRLSGDGGATLDILGPEAVFGESALGDGLPYPARAEAVEAVEVLVIPGAAVRSALAADPAALGAVLGALSVSLRTLVSQVNELKMKTATQRLGLVLLTLSDWDGVAASAREAVLPYSKRLLADKLGMTPETLSRAQAKLLPLGVEALPRAADGRQGWTIADPPVLAAFCGFGTEDWEDRP